LRTSISLADIFNQLKIQLVSKNLPEPKITSYGSADQLEILPNRSYNQQVIKQATEFNEQLSQRRLEIKAVYREVARSLQSITRGQIDDDTKIILKDVKDFLEDAITAQDFIELCSGTNSEPDIPNYETLAKRLFDGKFVIFLGTELPDAAFPNVNEIVSQFANYVKYNDFKGSLPEIFEYIEYHSDFQRETLCDKLKEISLKPPTPIRLYQFLATINQPMLLISAAYDTLLEQTFRDHNQPVIILCHSKNIGTFFLKYSDKTKIQECSGDKLSNLLDEKYTVIFKILGCFNGSTKEESFIASESNFFNFIEYQNTYIPAYIKKNLQKFGFLLLGHYPKSWEKRFIINELLKHTKQKPIIVLQEMDKFTSMYLKEKHNVKNYRIDLNEFIANLQRHL